jgi:hypothetical protein
MKNNKLKLDNYVKKYESFLEKEFCNSIVDEIKQNKNNFEKHNFFDPKTLELNKKSGDEEPSINYLYNNEKTDIIMKKLWHGIKQYLKDINIPQIKSWNAYSYVRYNIYDKKEKMADHIDHIQSLFDGSKRGIPFLSIVGILNDNYKGGEFIMFGNKEIKLKQGDLLIFPSIFLYPHRVNPVKKGIRYSFVSWVW